jgi:hypothetical protein
MKKKAFMDSSQLRMFIRKIQNVANAMENIANSSGTSHFPSQRMK